MRIKILTIVMVVLTFTALVSVEPVYAETVEMAEVLIYDDIPYESSYDTTIGDYVGGYTDPVFIPQSDKRPTTLYMVDDFTYTGGSAPLRSFVQFGTTSSFTTTLSGGFVDEMPWFVGVPDGYNWVRFFTSMFVPSGSNASETWAAFYVNNDLELMGFTSGIIIQAHIIETLFSTYYAAGYDLAESETEEYYEQYIIPDLEDDAYDDGYSEGYSEGLAQGPEDALALQNMLPGILGSVFAFVFQVFSINVLGISIMSVIVLLAGAAVAIMVFKLFFK
jgi:uncharacterized membrane protein YeaQ/YmgE (transglycosylase-associated protein family)